MTNIHCFIQGRGAPVVLVHGWGMHGGVWREFARELSKSRQVICLDLPGHGLSSDLYSHTLENISRALLDAIPVQRFSLLGWSLGATVALDMAYRCPSRVNTLVMLAGNAKFVETSDWPGVQSEILDAFAKQLSEDPQFALIRFLALQTNGMPDSKSLLKKLKKAVLESGAPSWAALTGGLEILRQSDLRASLGGLACPCVHIQGGKDMLIPAATGLAAKKINPAIDVRLMEEAGHLPFLSHQSRLLDIMRDVLPKD